MLQLSQKFFSFYIHLFILRLLNNQITSEDYVLDHLDWDHINPATGPIYIEGAKVGDVLKVEILDIEL